jgi:tousled-like kinase
MLVQMGVIFFQTLYGRRPFGEGQSQEQILQAGTMLEQTRLGPVFPDRPVVSRGAQDFIRRCLTYNVDLRPDMLTLCRDPFLLQTTDSRIGSAASRR